MSKEEILQSGHTSNDLYTIVIDMRERLARVEQKVEDMESEIKYIKKLLVQRNGYMKWMIVMLGMILSFIAALFGIGWKP